MINKKTSINIMLILLSAVLIFHLLVLTQVISYKVVWAGRLNSLEEMYVFEGVSILINLIMMLVILIKKKHDKVKVINIIIWGFVVLFALNTLGNLTAQNIIEKIVGTALTFISAFLCWTMVRKPQKA